MKEEIKVVPKVWGEEWWLVNNDKYCGKLLKVDRGAESSLHYHPVKQETFYCLDGQVGLIISGKSYMLGPYSRPKTIMPLEAHMFTGLIKSVILEISTHHDDNDVVRLSESRKGYEDGMER